MRLHSGQRAWLLQRLTALLLLAACFAGVVTLLRVPQPGYAQWRAFFADGHGATLTAVAYLAACLHGWVGARDVILDYVQPTALRIAALVLVGVLLLATSIRLALLLAAQFVR